VLKPTDFVSSLYPKLPVSTPLKSRRPTLRLIWQTVPSNPPARAEAVRGRQPEQPHALFLRGSFVPILAFPANVRPHRAVIDLVQTVRLLCRCDFSRHIPKLFFEFFLYSQFPYDKIPLCAEMARLSFRASSAGIRRSAQVQDQQVALVVAIAKGAEFPHPPPIFVSEIAISAVWRALHTANPPSTRRMYAGAIQEPRSTLYDSHSAARRPGAQLSCRPVL
jgi:hypothetical protein